MKSLYITSVEDLNIGIPTGNQVINDSQTPLKKDLIHGDKFGETTLSLLQYIQKFVLRGINSPNKKIFTLQIEKELQTPVLHYLLFFKDYVKGAKKKDIHFEVFF